MTILLIVKQFLAFGSKHFGSARPSPPSGGEGLIFYLTSYAVAISGAGFFAMFAKKALAFAAIWSFVRSCLCVAMDH